MSKSVNGKNESSVRRVLNNEIVQVLTIIAVVYSFVALVILPLNHLVDKVDAIENNHLVHIQKSIDEIKDQDKKQDAAIVEIVKNLERLNVVHDQILKKNN